MRIARFATPSLLLLLLATTLTLTGCCLFGGNGDDDGRSTKAPEEPVTVVEARDLASEAPSEDIGETREARADRLAGNAQPAEGLLVPIYFDFDRSDVRSDQVERLESNAAYLKQNPGQTTYVEGHTDSRGAVEYNFALAARRANAVKEFLASRGVKQAKIETISKGEEEPAVAGAATEEGHALNRRAEFKISR